METIDALAERISRGEGLTDADARVVLETRDLVAIGVVADDVRRRRHGLRTTFVRVFEIHVDAPVSALPAQVTAGEIRITGPPATAEAALAATRATAALAAGTPITGFSLPDLRAVAAAAGRTFADVCADLRAAGLQAIAEVPIDAAIAVAVYPDIGDDIRAARRAGLMVARLVVHSLPPHARIAIATAARDLQAGVGGFKVFAPLPRTISIAEPTTGYDDVKQIALARLLVGNIDSIQVDWPLYGPKLAQVALTMGADDVDGVAAFDPGLLGTRRSAIEEIRGNIRAAALEPIERNARFEAVGV